MLQYIRRSTIIYDCTLPHLIPAYLPEYLGVLCSILLDPSCILISDFNEISSV